MYTLKINLKTKQEGKYLLLQSYLFYLKQYTQKDCFMWNIQNNSVETVDWLRAEPLMIGGRGLGQNQEKKLQPLQWGTDCQYSAWAPDH